jgi:hypothetical protein
MYAFSWSAKYTRGREGIRHVNLPVLVFTLDVPYGGAKAEEAAVHSVELRSNAVEIGEVGAVNFAELGVRPVERFGVLANRRHGELLPLCRTLLCRSVPDREPATAELTSSGERTVWPCPQCQGPMHVLERLTALQISFEESRHVYVVDSS